MIKFLFSVVTDRQKFQLTHLCISNYEIYYGQRPRKLTFKFLTTFLHCYKV